MNNKQYVLCVPLILKCYLKPQYQNIIKNTTLQKFKNWYFIFHTCLFLESIPVANNTARYLNVRSNNMKFYDGMIMEIRSYPVLLMKYNMNSMVEIDMYPLKSFH